jgi:hypothetical protein
MNEHDIPDEDLIAIARRLGVLAAGRVDPERTAIAVLERLRQPARRAWQPAWLALAAALVLCVGGGAVLKELAHHRTGPAPVTVDVSGLSAHQLGEVLNGINQPDINAVDEEPASVESGIEELTPAELRNLVKSLTS